MRRFPTPPRSLWVIIAGAAVLWLLARLITGGGTGGGTGAPAHEAAAKPPAPAVTGADAAPGVPALWPRPASVTRRAGSVPVTASVWIRASRGADAATLDAVTHALTAAGAGHVRRDGAPARGELLVSVNADGSPGALAALRVAGPAGLPSGGYVLAAGRDGGRPVIVLAGADPLGAFYAAQTLAQLVRPVGAAAANRVLPALAVRDRPATPARGVVEGFYGTPWTQEQRLAQLDFDARYKLNTYLYSPKADPYLRNRWRDPYPPEQLALLRQLTQRARADHVTFGYALSPGTSVCYSAAGDAAAVGAKFQQLWNLGVRNFAVPLDDIDIDRFNCAADRVRYGSGKAAVGRAQADFLNRVQRGFAATHAGMAPLLTVPTEYGELKPSGYKSALAGALDPSVTVVWTGPQVVSQTLTAAQLRSARGLYRHPVLVWDNYPVNDYTAGRLHLGPYEGRARDLPGVAAGITVNPMNQAAASDPVLFAAAAFAWNPDGYDPAGALDAGLSALAGGDARVLAALRVFADVNHGSRIDGAEAPVLAELIADYRRGGAAAEQALRDRLGVLAQAPSVLSATLPDAGPWLTAASQWARAALAALDLPSGRAQAKALRAAARAHTTPDYRGHPHRVEIAPTVLAPFLTSRLS